MDTIGQRSNYDPFTGAGRYIPDAEPSSARKTTTLNQDPFTGTGRYIPNGDNFRSLSASQSSVISMKYYLTIDYIKNFLFI